MKKIIVILSVLLLSSVLNANVQQTMTAVVKLTQTAGFVVYATQTEVARLTAETNAVATKTAVAQAILTTTAVAKLTQGITDTPTLTVTLTKTVTTVCSPTPTKTADTRTNLQKTQTAITIYNQTKTAVAQITNTATVTKTITKTFTITNTFTATLTATPVQTIALTITSYGVNSVGLQWNAPAYTTKAGVRLNGTPSVYRTGTNLNAVSSMTLTANILPGKNIIDVIVSYWNTTFGVGAIITSTSSAQTIYNITNIDPSLALNRLNSAGLLVTETFTSPSTTTVGYLSVTKYATDRLYFNVQATSKSSTAMELWTGGTAELGGTRLATFAYGDDDIGSANPPAGCWIIPAGTWIKLSVTAASGTDAKTISWTNCDLADYAKIIK